MKHYFKGSALLISLMLIISVLAVLFLNKEKWIQQKNITVFYSEKSIADKYQLLTVYPSDKNSLCRQHKKEIITQADLTNAPFYFLQYQFNCQFQSLFKARKPSKEKYIQFEQIADYLDLTNVPSQELFYITSLAELPPSSENEPKIVIAKNAINETLPQNFYGIVITDYHFDITGKKMFGTLYSRFDNAREERNLTFKKEVLANLEAKYSYWQFLPQSEQIMGAANE